MDINRDRTRGARKSGWRRLAVSVIWMPSLWGAVRSTYTSTSS